MTARDIPCGKVDLMKMIPVVSSNVATYGYDAVRKVLRVEFKGGGQWEYDRVEPDDMSALAAADSFGSHLHRFIKPNFSARKL